MNFRYYKRFSRKVGMMKNIIYGLQDPRTDDIMYVGKSTQGMDRPKQHLSGSHNSLVRDWVNSLNADNLEPNILVLEGCEEPSFLLDKEKFWIDKLLKEHHPLLNTIIYESHLEKRISIAKIEKELDTKIKNLSQKIVELSKGESETLSIDNKSLGRMVKNRRKLAGLTQKELADISGVGKTVVFDIEKGKKTVQSNSLNKTLDALGIKTVYFIPSR